MRNRLLIAAFATLLGSASLHAKETILVASSRSNSIEEFNTGGTWISTFATTGPYVPAALAQSPLTGEIFVTTIWGPGSGIIQGQLTNKILRYEHTGDFDTNWDTFAVAAPPVVNGRGCPTSQTQSLLFDPSGNLWVATAYGTDSGGQICILKYLAADLTLPNPPAQPSPMILATLTRGGQMAFDTSGHLCIASFIDGDVQCFDPSTGAPFYDNYKAEIAASGLAVEPGGLAFDGSNRLYLTSIFTGQLVGETSPGVSIVKLATLPNQLQGNLVLHFASGKFSLYTTTYYASPPTFTTPDAVYEVSLTGTVTKLIYGTAPPALGSDHIWGAYWMIFASL